MGHPNYPTQAKGGLEWGTRLILDRRHFFPVREWDEKDVGLSLNFDSLPCYTHPGYKSWFLLISRGGLRTRTSGWDAQPELPRGFPASRPVTRAGASL
jgi:hypothetical protein